MTKSSLMGKDQNRLNARGCQVMVRNKISISFFCELHELCGTKNIHILKKGRSKVYYTFL